ncbi:MAG: lysophospholipid acyltransferase family protein [Holosporaceae bacterium]|jgi:1-acyl-sn-glycerol-3-phosphate acyltransferase
MAINASKYIFSIVTKIFVFVFIGVNVRRKNLIPNNGPAIVIANHNSHLDTIVLMSLFSLSKIHLVRPVASAEYFLKNRFLSWLTTRVIEIIPLEHGKASKDFNPLSAAVDALQQNKILIFFPEGTRGEPEKIVRLQKGIVHLASYCPKVPITPVFIHGLGKTLPKGERVFVPFFCDIFVGDPMFFEEDKHAFLNNLTETFKNLATEGHFHDWE